MIQKNLKFPSHFLKNDEKAWNFRQLCRRALSGAKNSNIENARQLLRPTVSYANFGQKGAGNSCAQAAPGVNQAQKRLSPDFISSVKNSKIERPTTAPESRACRQSRDLPTSGIPAIHQKVEQTFCLVFKMKFISYQFAFELKTFSAFMLLLRV